MSDGLEAFLYQAMAAHFGIALTVTNFQTVSQQLYKTRKSLSDPRLAALSFRRCPFNQETELWIVRGQASVVPGHAASPETQAEGPLDLSSNDPIDLTTKGPI